MTPDRRRISAMLRVRNEEEFLYASVGSIADRVDEIVLVDNRSSDRTPEIIETLRREHGRRVRSEVYPHEVRRVGRETWDLANESGATSPHHSAAFYNWCLARCRHPYVLKWDGDMIALERLRQSLAAWRDSELEVLIFRGINVHPDRRHRIAAKVTDREPLLEQLSVPALPIWATSLSHDAAEPRLFPRSGAEYVADLGWTQRLSAPRLRDRRDRRFVRSVAGECFLHMKFCKRDPLANYTEDLAAVIASNLGIGAPLDPEMRNTLERWGHAEGRDTGGPA